MADTSIEWATKVWNPVRGCSIVSAGCRSCYAMKQAHRFAGPGGKYEGLTKMTRGGPVWTGEARTVPDMLDAPLHWRKPQRVFVNSMSDLFHEDVGFDFVSKVFAVMARCNQHTFQVLTKRPERMREYLGDPDRKWSVLLAGAELPLCAMMDVAWPLPNVWLGVSVEDQATANERIPLLLETPAAVRWVSAEPLLEEVIIFSLDGPVDVPDGMSSPLHWIVVGGESGHGARAFDVAWARGLIEQCRDVGVPVFCKQMGAHVVDRNDAGFDGIEDHEWPDGTRVGDSEMYQGAPARVHLRDRKGGDPDEWPADLRVRQFPEVRS